MLIVLKSKLYNLVVNDANANYEGSITIDGCLLSKAGINEYEQVHVLDVTNGTRLITYAMRGKEGEVCINGAATKKIDVGDTIMVLAYCTIDTGIKIREPKIINQAGVTQQVEYYVANVVVVGSKPIIRSGEK